MLKELSHEEVKQESKKYLTTPTEELALMYVTLCQNPPAFTQPVGELQTGDEWTSWRNQVNPVHFELRRRWKLQGLIS